MDNLLTHAQVDDGEGGEMWQSAAEACTQYSSQNRIQAAKTGIGSEPSRDTKAHPLKLRKSNWAAGAWPLPIMSGRSASRTLRHAA